MYDCVYVLVQYLWIGIVVAFIRQARDDESDLTDLIRTASATT